jgi:integrase
MNNNNNIKFTKERLQALPLPAAGHRNAYKDTDADGLELRVSSTGVKTFSWYRRVKNGPPERVTLGRFPEMTVLRAREEAGKLNTIRISGDSPATERRTRRNELLFGELFDQYIERHAKVHKKTWKEDQQRYDQYLAMPLGRLKVSDVKRETVSKVHAKITADGHPAVANRVLALVSSVFGRAVEWSILEANPIKGIRRNKEVSRDRFLDGDEMPRFMASLQAEPNDVVRDFFLLCLLTGARRANVLSMAWADISLDGANWRIPVTKAGESLNVPLTSETIAILRRRRAADPSGRFVLPGSGEKGHFVEPKKAWLRIFDRDELDQIIAKLEQAGEKPERVGAAKVADLAGRILGEQLAKAKARAAELKLDISNCRLSDARIHDLRRTQGSWQAMTGTSLQIIGKSLGHKNVTTTTIYARLQTDPVLEAMTKATDAMLKGVDRKVLG